jgi:NitT/TauT family transport system substrate-binding protein
MVLVLLVAGAFGCDPRGGSDAGAGGGTGESARPAGEVRLGYFPNLTHAQAVLGVSSGEFVQAIAPAKLTTRTFNAGPSLIEALFAGEIDVGYIGPGPALSGYSKSRGQGLRVVAGAAANGVVIVARRDSGITSLEDLRGKRIATPQHGNTQDISARHYLLSVLKQADVSNVLPVANTEQPALMASGQIDAAWAPEPWGARLVSETGATIIAEEKDLWPHREFGLTVVITTPEFLAGHSQTLEKLLAVHTSWTRRLQEQPDACLPKFAEALAGLTGKTLPPGVLESAMARVKFSDEPLPETFTTYAQWSYDLGFSRQQTDVSALIDTSVLRRAQTQSEARSAGIVAGPATAKAP